MHKKTNIGYMLMMVLHLLASCKGSADSIKEEVTITMSASVNQTKALITSIDDLKNSHSIGIYGFKEQNNNTDNKFLVFDNQQLQFALDKGWYYAPARYWDMQTRYSFIAYAPYSPEDVSINNYNSITISDIPQYQDATVTESKDYLVALNSNHAKVYVENYNKTVNLAFHHILANFQIWAYYEGFDTEFKITGLYLGANSNGQKVPASDASRSYTQLFDAERANGDFNTGDWNNNNVQMPVNEFVVPKNAADVAQVANLLIVPFVADASGNKKLPLTIEYTKNGVAQKPATVSIGISGFESDNKYRLDLKFESKGAVVVPVDIQIKNWTETVVDPSDIHNW